MNKKGFTLIEIMIAVSIFGVVMVISMDIFLKAFSSQRRIIEMQRVQREGFYVMEIMSRKIRMATVIDPQSSDPNESINQDSSFYFENDEEELVQFCRSDFDGVCNNDDTGDYIAYGLQSVNAKDLIISSDVKVENLRFYVAPEEVTKKQHVITIDLDLVSTKNPDVKIDLQSSIATRIYSEGDSGSGGAVPVGYCGDGTVQNPNGDGDVEECDDGNNITGDGCFANCIIEPEFVLEDEYSVGGHYRTLWTDGVSDIYTADFNNNVMESFSFDGNSLVKTRETSLFSTGIRSIWGDGTYIYADTSQDWIVAYDSDLNKIDYIDTYELGGDWHDIWGDGNYVYATAGGNGFKVLDFDGTNFSEEGTDLLADKCRGVWGYGDYVYVANEDDGLIVYDRFNGSSLNRRYDLNNGYYNWDLWGDGTYIYVVAEDRGVLVYTFDGSTLNLEGEVIISGDTHDVWYRGGYIFVVSDKLYAYQFDGFNFIEIDSIAVEGGIWGLQEVMGDGTYIYVVGGDGLKAFSFE